MEQIFYSKRKYSFFVIQIIFFFTLAFFPPLLQANEPVHIDETLDIHNISNHVQYYVDHERCYTIQKIRGKGIPWKDNKINTINFGYTKSPIWFRLAVLNKTNKSLKWLLKFDLPILGLIEVYLPDGAGGFFQKKTGNTLPFHTRDVDDRTFIFRMNEKPGSSIYYIRIDSRDTIRFNIISLSPESYTKMIKEEMPIYWIYFGILLTMIIFNLLLYSSVREKAYIYLALFITGIFFYKFSFEGFTAQYLFPETPWFSQPSIVSFSCLNIFFVSQYLLAYYEIKTSFQKFYKIALYSIVVPSMICALLPFILTNDIVWKIFFVLGLWLISFFTFLMLKINFRTQSRSVIIMFLAFLPMIVAFPVAILYASGNLPISIPGRWSMQIGSALTVIFLSFILANKMSALEKELAQLNNELELKVEERTRQLFEANQQLMELDKMKARFFANISHEIRTPLTMIVSPLESYLQGDAGTVIDEIFFVKMHRNALRLLKLVNNLLDFSQIETGKTTLKIVRTNIVKLLNMYVDMIQTVAVTREVTINFESQSRFVYLYIDLEMIEKSFTNLFSNAIKFTEAGGTIDVRIRDDEDNCHISITDTGIGIPAEMTDAIFQRFLQVDTSSTREYEGSGMGLSLVKEFIEMNDGSIGVESRPRAEYPDNHGTTFTITFPKKSAKLLNEEGVQVVISDDLEKHISGMKQSVSILKSEITKRTDETISASASELKVVYPDVDHGAVQSSILIVEDNPDLRDFLTDLLKGSYEVITAVNGEDGFQKARLYRPDLILTDVMMPKMNGYELTKKLKGDEELKRIPVVMLTAKADIANKIEGLEYGVNDYLTKPFNTKELQMRIKTHLKTRIYEKQISERNRELNDSIRELKKTQKQLFLQEKLASLGMLTTGIAHEIQEPLNLVKNLAEVSVELSEEFLSLIINNCTEISDEVRKFGEEQLKNLSDKIGRISEHSNRIDSIIQGMNLHTREHQVCDEKTYTYINRLIDEYSKRALKELEQKYPASGIEVLKEFDKTVGFLNVFPHDIGKVFLNLLNNSFYSLVEKKKRGVDFIPRVHVSTRYTSEGIEIEIHDNGIGVPKSIKKDLSIPFHTTRPAEKGIGLGLSLCYDIITNRHQGELKVESVENEFARFTIFLPVG